MIFEVKNRKADVSIYGVSPEEGVKGEERWRKGVKGWLMSVVTGSCGPSSGSALRFRAFKMPIPRPHRPEGQMETELVRAPGLAK